MKRVIATTQPEQFSEDHYRLFQDVKDFVEGRRGQRKFSKLELDGIYLERHSIQSLINNYIRYFNRNVSDYGNGFEADWDPDDWMYILYKNGRVRTINPEEDEGTRKISVDNIDSIILDGSWGTAFAGPSITVEDYTVYEDIPDFRIEFM